jgi:uncharacterized protein (DUF58 family)
VTRTLNWLTVALFAIAVGLRNPIVFLIAVLLALVAGLTALWDRYALAGVTYTRRIAAPRLFVGEETDLTVEIVNAKLLPLAWLKAEDEWPGQITLQRGRLGYSWKPGRRLLHNMVSLRFYERVRKQYRLRAEHRGALEFGPCELRAGDIFGFREQHMVLAEPDWLIVYPKVVPVTALGLPAAHPFGEARTLRRVVEDPLRVSGVRPYMAGDSPRFIHWRATARRGDLQTKVFDPAAAPTTALFLDVRTLRDSPGMQPDYLEYAISATASLARALLDAREAVGLYVNGTWRNAETLTVRLPPARRPMQWFDILDALARLSGYASLNIERLLYIELSRLPFGATVVVVSAVPREELSAALLDARRAGHPVALVAIGEEPPQEVPEEIPAYWIGGQEAYRRLMEGKLDALDIGGSQVASGR